METKQIVFTRKNVAELLTVEYKKPAEKEVTVKLVYTAISAGTERANIIGISNIGPGIKEDEEAVFPRTCGYSGVGIVEDVGPGVEKVKKGDRVIVFWGKHVGHITISEENVVKVEDDSIAMKDAAITFISTFPAAAIRKTRLEFGESVIIMGLGILGQFAVKQCCVAGAYPVIAVDPIKERRDFALKNGADYALDPTKPDFIKNVKDITKGGVNVSIEVTGLGIGLEQSLDCMAKFGRVALLGCTRNSDFKIDYYSKVHAPGITIIGAHTIARPKYESSPGNWTHKDDINAMLKLMSGKRLNFSNMISDIYSPEDAQEIYSRLINDKNFPIGVLFDWSRIKNG